MSTNVCIQCSEIRPDYLFLNARYLKFYEVKGSSGREEIDNIAIGVILKCPLLILTIFL